MTEDNFNQESGAMDKPSYAHVELDDNTLNVVLRSFKHVLEHKGAAPTMDDQGLVSIDRLESLTDRIQSLQTSSEDAATIPMNFSDWEAYTAYISYAKDVVPDDGDRQRLKELSDEFEVIDKKFSRTARINESIEQHRGTLDELYQK